MYYFDSEIMQYITTNFKYEVHWRNSRYTTNVGGVKYEVQKVHFADSVLAHI